MPLTALLPSHVPVGDPDQCWEWTGHRLTPLAYGRVGSGPRKGQVAHRAVFEILHGPIPDGLIVRHRCDNPPCCNPAHLELGTHADNSRDKYTRGRAVHHRGEAHPCAKLDAEQVREIRALGATGLAHHRIAAQYGVSRSAVTAAISRHTWKSLP